MIKILPVGSFCFDVFFGDGWENWSRWNRSSKGFLTRIGGEEPPPFVKSFVIKNLK